VSTKAYLSIGDVLSTLREEFPDVTISKIRFLESQGLVNPQRSPSGYRKFYPADVERLRWVLRQQREHFLPLKVIKERLEAAFADGIPTTNGDQSRAPVPERATPPASQPGAASVRTATATAVAEAPIDAAAARAEKIERLATVVAALQEGPTGPVASDASRLGSRPEEEQSMEQNPVVQPGAVTLEELLVLSGLSADDVAQAEAQGLFAAVQVAGEAVYPDDAQQVAKVVGQLRRYGLEPRHLRPYRNAVDREIGLIEQVVTPLLRLHTPEARHKAAEHAAELAKLGQALRAALLRRELSRLLGS